MIQYFVDAPFALTADRRAAESWAGRPEILAKLKRICFGYTNRPDSSIALMWSNLGAGKTHALLHLSHLLRASNVVPTYVELPQQPKRFIDLYQRIIDDISSEDLIDAGLGARLSPDLDRVIRVLKFGSSDQHQVVRSWLAAGKPPLRELKAASGIGSRIEDDLRAREVFCAIIDAFKARGRRLVVLLDEFQRIGSVSSKQREIVLSHLRSVFSRHPSQFSLVIAVASRIEKTALELLPSELRSLMGVQPAMALPEMNRDEALDFAMGRLAAFRPAGYEGDPAAPFGQAALNATVDFIADQDSARLIPRTLLQALGYLYDNICSTAPASALSVVRVRELLGELRWND